LGSGASAGGEEEVDAAAAAVAAVVAEEEENKKKNDYFRELVQKAGGGGKRTGLGGGGGDSGDGEELKLRKVERDAQKQKVNAAKEEALANKIKEQLEDEIGADPEVVKQKVRAAKKSRASAKKSRRSPHSAEGCTRVPLPERARAKVVMKMMASPPPRTASSALPYSG
jgi:hypothetical protein